ncbi:hypothetical protein KAU08_03630 [bacterium]|nr:hypothetical protein [bacterium]
MTKKYFEFYLYRLNIVEVEQTLFNRDLRSIEGDEDIIQILQRTTSPEFKSSIKSKKAMYEWAIREFTDYEHNCDPSISVVGITLARSLLERDGKIVTDNGIVEGPSESEPPLADTMQLFFQIQRHLTACECVSSILNTARWRQAFQELTKAAASDLGYSVFLELEPIPKKEEIIYAFQSFERLTRLRVKLRLPNPELTRYANQLYEEMLEGGIREYLQDMRNPKGLSRSKEHMPYASIEIAQAGYKKGEVTLQGMSDGRMQRKQTGAKAMRGTIDQMRDFVRGISKNTRSKEAKNVVTEIMEEIDRLSPPPNNIT